jgi:hypothetical protein
MFYAGYVSRFGRAVEKKNVTKIAHSYPDVIISEVFRLQKNRNRKCFKLLDGNSTCLLL